MSEAQPKCEDDAPRYATLGRERQESFMSYVPHDGPTPIDYLIWVIRNAERTILVNAVERRSA